MLRQGFTCYTNCVKTDRLLSIIIYLLNRDLVSARELADKFEVSVRTIQRDMEAIELAGIPIMTIQGPSGGYAIMDSFKLDRQLVSADDLFFIITALHGIETSLPGGSISGTIEKMKGLLPRESDTDGTVREVGGQGRRSTSGGYSSRLEKLSIDFSAFGGSERQREIFKQLEGAIDSEVLVRFSYQNNRMERSERVVEPMTLAFRWRSWYLFGYCTLRQDYRLFRLGRIRNVELLGRTFRRREKRFDEFFEETNPWQDSTEWIDITLKFDPYIRPVVEEFYEQEKTEEGPNGSLIAHVRMPEDGWVYGLILSYGKFVEVLAPQRLRGIISSAARDICRLYE